MYSLEKKKMGVKRKTPLIPMASVDSFFQDRELFLCHFVLGSEKSRER